MNALLDRASVRRVQAALETAGSTARVIALAETARTADDAAASLGVPVGAIVKSLVFTVAAGPVMALVAGDRRCETKTLARVLGLAGKVRRADAEIVREATGFSIGGVAPLAHPQDLPTTIDASLGRFEAVYAAAGHPHCVFATTLAELAELTGGTVTEEVATPLTT
jgi:prolyl-tRNA editing enzyme YbaK/EbsC (Cys-tRNA(Pro) deacylase)